MADTAAQQTLPGTGNDSSSADSSSVDKTSSEADARVKAAEERAARLEAVEKKRRADEAAAKKKAEEDKAIADGETKRVLEAREKELEEQRSRNEEYESAYRARIDRAIEKLPDASKKKIEAVREDLSLVKLEALVEAEAESAQPSSESDAPPATTPGAPRDRPGKLQLSADAEDKVASLGYTSEHMRSMERVQDPHTGAQGFRYPVRTLIEKFRDMAPATSRLSIAEARRQGRIK